MKTLLLKNAKLVLEDKIIDGSLLIKDEIIEKIIESKYDEIIEAEEVIDVEGKLIIPGFIDVHIHGAAGYDTMDSSEESYRGMSKFLASKGVTNFLPTTLTSPHEELLETLKVAANLQNKNIEGANIFGIHMEGPHFDIEFKGAQDERFMSKASCEILGDYLGVKKDLVRLMSMSASREEDIESIKFLKKHGVIVSVGHSNGTYDNLVKGIEAGITHATHTYNGMRGFGHRELGIVGGVLVSDEIKAEVIFDKIHVHPKAVEVLIRAKGIDKVLLISDSMSAAGLEDGDYKLGKLDVYVSEGQARLKSNDALAGSVLTLDKAFRNVIELGYSIFDAVKMTSTNQAKEFGLNSGKIEIGRYADLAILDNENNVNLTLVRGKIKFKK